MKINQPPDMPKIPVEVLNALSRILRGNISCAPTTICKPEEKRDLAVERLRRKYANTNGD